VYDRTWVRVRASLSDIEMVLQTKLAQAVTSVSCVRVSTGTPTVLTAVLRGLFQLLHTSFHNLSTTLFDI
jgi:hypothetical protein